MKEGDSCTTAGGQDGFAVPSGPDDELVCVAGKSVEEARANAAAAVHQVRNPESDKSIERNYPNGREDSNA